MSQLYFGTNFIAIDCIHLLKRAGGWNEIYLILTSEFKQEKIYYVTSDFNIEWQVKKLKRL